MSKVTPGENFFRKIFVKEKLSCLGVYTAPPGIDLSQIKLKDFTGLAVVSRVENSDGTAKVYAYWESSDALRAGAAKLQSALGLGKLESEGVLTAPKMEKKRFWQITSGADLLTKL